MLACVCQPADPGIFRRSPVPLGAPPLKIPPGFATPRRGRSKGGSGGFPRHPGRTVRMSPPSSVVITDAPSPSLKSDSGGDSVGSSNNSISIGSSGGGSGEGSTGGKRTKPKRTVPNSFGVVTSTDKGRSENDSGSPSRKSDDCDNSRAKSEWSKEGLQKLPDGVQLTLSELREMACRQQSQIDSQHQLLAAKEQRLRYLKEQEQRQQRVHAESERLRRLRDRVDAQELKLRKLRALRGQVDHQKQNNISLTSDLDSIRALFNEKEKELSLAVAKVEELTRQLEELRRGRTARDQPPASALELDKLRRELMYRNKLNEQQNQRLNQQREALTARQEEMSAIDKRISELQERLHKKRLLNQQLANQISAASHKAAYHQLVRLTGNSEQNNQAFARKQHQNAQQSNGLSRGNIAAVEPYNHVPLRPQAGKGPTDNNGNPAPATYHPVYQQQNSHHIKKEEDIGQGDLLANKVANLFDQDALKDFAVSKSDPKYQTLPYNTKFTVNLLPNRIARNDNHAIESILGSATANSEGKDNPDGHLATNLAHMTVHSAPLTVVNKNIATPLNQTDLLSRKGAPPEPVGSGKDGVGLPNGGYLKQPQTSSEHPGTVSNGITYQKPISSVAPTSVHHTGVISNIYQTSSIKVQPVEPQTIMTSGSTNSTKPIHPSQTVQSPQSLPLSPPQSSSTPLNGTPEISADKIPKPALPPKPAIKPPPRQSSQPIGDLDSPPPPLPLSEPPPIEDAKLRPKPPIGATNVGGGGNAAGVGQPPIGKAQMPPPPPVSSGGSEMIIKAKPLTIKKQPLSEQPKLRFINSMSKLNGVSMNARRTVEAPPQQPIQHFGEMQEKVLLDQQANQQAQQQQQQQHHHQENCSSNGSTKDISGGAANIQKPALSTDETDRIAMPAPSIIPAGTSGSSTASTGSEEDSGSGKDDRGEERAGDHGGGVIRRCKKGNLKQTGKSNLSRRVSFDPLALLLDASLEGELELVKKTATQVPNPSAANDEGITALHNAICAGHLEIVKYLVGYGCDVNAQDSDGWTPLHCAASCNNVAMVKFLVEHGACIFATTLSDHETAAEKCEEDEEGFDGCSEYLYSVQEKLGILSGGVVYAVFDYTAQQPDELSFKAGQQLTVLRKGDENEREWWWSKLGDKEGYVPRNLLGLYPRVNRSEE